MEYVRGGMIFDPSYVTGSDRLWTSVTVGNILLAQPWLFQPDGPIRFKWA